MKTWSFLIFFSIVLTIYGLVNFYIFRRAWTALEGAGIYRVIFLYVFLFLVLCYPLGRIGEQLARNSFTEFLVIVGSIYLGMMVYAFLFLIIIDLLRLVNFFLPFFPEALSRYPVKTATSDYPDYRHPGSGYCRYRSHQYPLSPGA